MIPLTHITDQYFDGALQHWYKIFIADRRCATAVADALIDHYYVNEIRYITGGKGAEIHFLSPAAAAEVQDKINALNLPI